MLNKKTVFFVLSILIFSVPCLSMKKQIKNSNNPKLETNMKSLGKNKQSKHDDIYVDSEGTKWQFIVWCCGSKWIRIEDQYYYNKGNIEYPI